MPQRVISDLGSISRLINILQVEDAKNIMLVTGKKSFFASGASAAIEPIFKHFNVIRFKDFEINPKFEDAKKGSEIARKNKIDTIVSIGGGSVIDIAKLILAFLDPNQDVEKIIDGSIKAKPSKLRHISIPTTAGTGSESTHFAVVYKNKRKFSVAADFLMPDIVLLDGILFLSNSPNQKAFNGLDALAQAIESHWSCGSTNESKSFSRKAIPILFKQLPRIVSGEATKEEFQCYVEAANLAGKAIDISKTTSPHAFSYSFTSEYSIPHGQAVWLTLPKIFEVHKNAIDSGTQNIINFKKLEVSIKEIINLLGINQIDISNELKKYVLRLGLECRMEKLGLNTKSSREQIARKVNLERLKNNPVILTEKNICEIFNY